jgi:type I restriction enzyme S subunit
MSNKQDYGMNKTENARALVPNLRFPEFQETNGWSLSLLGNVCDMQAGKFVAAAEISLQSGVDLFPCYGGNGLRGYTKTHTHSGRYSLIGRQGSLCGNVTLVDGRFHATEHAVVATPKTGIHTEWLFHELGLLNLNRFATGQALPGLSVEVLNRVECAIPKDEAEQKKIADCLSSLDYLIHLEAEKLDSIKTHKKGLMQQLFPAENEKLPSLRFPEFLDANKWDEKVLGPMTIKIGSGITPTGGDKNYKTAGRPFVRSQNVGWGELILNDVVFIDEGTHQSFDSTEICANDVLLNITGASIGRSATADSRVVGGNVNQHVCIIRTKPNELNHTLLNPFLISERGQKQIDSFQAGGNRQGLNFAQIRSFLIPLPPTETEQKAIANCLSSLDELIAAQAQKLDTLKTHKKGLMQQLFPQVEEADA